MFMWAHYAKVFNIVTILCRGVLRVYPCGEGEWGSVTMLLWAHYAKVSNIVTILCRGVYRIYPCGEGEGWLEL